MSKNKKIKRNKSVKQRSLSANRQSIIHAEIEEKFVSSPIPPSEMAAQYEALAPGAADRILSLAEQEATHRRKMGEKAVNAQIELLRESAKDTKRGQLFGFIIGLSAILASAYMATHGAQVVGGAVGVSSLVGLVSVFIHGRKQQPTHPSKPKGEPYKGEE